MELAAHARLGHGGDPLGLFAQRGDDRCRRREPARGHEPGRAQHAQRILGEAFGSASDAAQPRGRRVGVARERVEHAAFAIDRERVQREIAVRELAADARPVGVGHELDRARGGRQHHALRPRVERNRAREQREQRAAIRRSGDLEVAHGLAVEQSADRGADRVGLVSVRRELRDHGRDRGRKANRSEVAHAASVQVDARRPTKSADAQRGEGERRPVPERER